MTGFDWDENKQKINLIKHGIDFANKKKRIISARRASKNERKKYFQTEQNLNLLIRLRK